MTTAVVLFTRDLRVHDHPALDAACSSAATVVPLFVLDERILDSSFAAANRLSHLVSALGDLDQALRERGSSLVVRRGDVVDEVVDVLRATGATSLHLSQDWSRHAVRRQADLADACGDVVAMALHPGHLLHDPGTIVPTSGGDAFRVFTPYWRRWKDQDARRPTPAPSSIPGPHDVTGIAVPLLSDLTEASPSPQLAPGGERAARARLADWLDGPIEDYEDGHDRIHDPSGTSGLSADLHLGTIGIAEVVDALDRRRRGHDAFERQLCWREYNHQLLGSRPEIVDVDIRPRGDDWRDAPDELERWRQGRTGYPIVDAGMRQLLAEGYMHNRARLLTASFLTKHLYLDWRLGAQHFADLLVDGDIANNWVNWQWVAGTGTDSRPNRMFNPITQAHRYDPDGVYVRRWVAELGHLDDPRLIHEPWLADEQLLARVDDYPAPMVDHDEARRRFLDARGA